MRETLAWFSFFLHFIHNLKQISNFQFIIKCSFSFYHILHNSYGKNTFATVLLTYPPFFFLALTSKLNIIWQLVIGWGSFTKIYWIDRIVVCFMKIISLVLLQKHRLLIIYHFFYTSRGLDPGNPITCLHFNWCILMFFLHLCCIVYSVFLAETCNVFTVLYVCVCDIHIWRVSGWKWCLDVKASTEGSYEWPFTHKIANFQPQKL